MIQLIFSEIRANHTPDGLKGEFLPRAAWAPYVDVVLARPKKEGNRRSRPVITSVARMGFEPMTSSLKGMVGSDQFSEFASDSGSLSSS